MTAQLMPKNIIMQMQITKWLYESEPEPTQYGFVTNFRWLGLEALRLGVKRTQILEYIDDTGISCRALFWKALR